MFFPNFAAGINQHATPDGTKFARVASRQAVCAPTQTTAYMRVVGGFRGQTALLEQMAIGCGPLLVTSALVQGTVYFAGMVNPTEKDFWVQPGTRIGIVQPAELLPPKYTGIVVNANEIAVGTKSAAPTTSEPSQLPIDLTAFEGAAQELQDVKALFSRHRSIFDTPTMISGATSYTNDRRRSRYNASSTHPYYASGGSQVASAGARAVGAIVPSDSAYASAGALIRKKTGALRMYFV